VQRIVLSQPTDRRSSTWSSRIRDDFLSDGKDCSRTEERRSVRDSACSRQNIPWFAVDLPLHHVSCIISRLLLVTISGALRAFRIPSPSVESEFAKLKTRADSAPFIPIKFVSLLPLSFLSFPFLPLCFCVTSLSLSSLFRSSVYLSRSRLSILIGAFFSYAFPLRLCPRWSLSCVSRDRERSRSFRRKIDGNTGAPILNFQCDTSQEIGNRKEFTSLRVTSIFPV
jgi:hypothetical protein